MPRLDAPATAPSTPTRATALPSPTVPRLDAPPPPTTPYRAHLTDGYEPTRPPYGTRLGAADGLRTPGTPSLAVPEPSGPPPGRLSTTPAPEPSIAERALGEFPLYRASPDARILPPMPAGSTSPVHDGTAEGTYERGRADARLDDRGRSAPFIPPPTAADPRATEALRSVEEEAHRAAWCAEPLPDRAAAPECAPD